MAQTALKLQAYERFSISKLAMRFDMDRVTCKKRLNEAGIQPVEVKARETLYELTPRVEVVLGKTDNALEAAKLRKEIADADLKEQKLAQLAGELVPIGDVIDIVQRLFGVMHKEVAVRQPKRLIGRIRKAKTAAAADKVWKVDTDRIFRTLREDFEKVLG